MWPIQFGLCHTQYQLEKELVVGQKGGGRPSFLSMAWRVGQGLRSQTELGLNTDSTGVLLFFTYDLSQEN